METRCDPRIMRVLDVMDRRMNEPWQVHDLAVVAELSPSRFAHLFHKWMGVSPVRYLQQLRMDRARLLLSRTSLSIREIMQIVGCTDPSHFGRAFRNQFGVGPGEYRQACRRL